jgi:hypothetical protein
MTRGLARDIAALVLRDVFPPDAPPASHDPAEAIRVALWRDAHVHVNAEMARALVRAGWRAP